MKARFFALLAISTVALVVLPGCRGGQCGNCGYYPQGYGQPYGQPQYGQPPAQPQYAPGTFIQQGQVGQQGFIQPGVVQPGQVAPFQTQPGAQFQNGTPLNGSGTR